MGVKVATVAKSISALSVSGVALKDVDGIPEEVTTRICPIMFPSPDGFVTNLRVEPQSFGAGDAGKNDVLYTLNYVFLYAPVGSDRYITKNIAKLVEKVVLILSALVANDAVTGSVDIEPRISGEFGNLSDPVGNEFFGALIAIDVKEFYEVSA